MIDDYCVDMYFVVRAPSGDVIKRYSGEVLSDSTISKIIDDVGARLNETTVDDSHLYIFDPKTDVAYKEPRTLTLITEGDK